MLTPKQIAAIVVLLLWAGSLWLAYDYGTSEAKADSAAEGRKAAERALDQIAEANRKAAAENARIRKALARPIAQEVADAVKDNPSDCRLPGPVVERVRDAIREANAAE